MQVNRESWRGPLLLLLGVPILFTIIMLLLITYLSGDILGLAILFVVIVIVNWAHLTYNYMEAWL